MAALHQQRAETRKAIHELVYANIKDLDREALIAKCMAFHDAYTGGIPLNDLKWLLADLRKPVNAPD